MKTGNGRLLTALAILAAILVAFGGCENFMSKDKSFKESIEKEVKVANAKVFKILVLGITGQATTSPTGQTKQKVDVPFTVLVQPSEAYGFIEWQAFSTTDTLQELPLDASIITFSDPKAMTTDVTVHVARDDIQIQPKTDKRPKLTSTSPGNGKDKVFLNVPIRIYFSKPMNPASFLFEDGTDKQGADKAITFKNITMTRQRGTKEPESCSYMYSPPKLDKTGKILTITPIIDQEGGYTVTIECSLLVTDTFGITMSESASFSFVYSGLKDNNPPKVTVNYVTGSNGIWSVDEKNPGHYPVTAGSIVTLGLDVSDGSADAPESQLSAIYILESRLKTDMDVPDGTAGTMITIDAYDNGKYEIPYTIQTSGDGMIQLSIWAKDTTDNLGDKAPFKYVYYRDTTAPNPDANIGNITILSDPPVGIYYNSNDHILDLITGSVVDVGASGYASTSNQFQIQLVGTNGLSKESDWCSASLTDFEIPPFFPDGDVTINYRLRDALENTSIWKTKGSVTKDTNWPTGTISVKDSTPIGAVTYLKASGDDVWVNLTANVAVGESPIAKYKVAHSTTRYKYDDIPVQIFEDYTGAPSYETDGIKVNDNGTHYFYVWFRDAAGNETPANSPMETIVAGDHEAPTIDNFTVTRSVSDASRYSNTTTWYFSITATDLASGVNEFSLEPSSSYSFVNRTSSGKSVTVSGTYTYTPSEQGEIPLAVTVTDNIGNKTSATRLLSGKEIYYDTESPDNDPLNFNAKFHSNDAVTGNKTTTGGISYYYNGSVLFTNKKDGHTLTVSLADSLSGAASFDVSGSGLESPVGVSLKPFTIGSPGPGATGTKSGTYIVNLSSGEGMKGLKVKARDFAENDVTLSPDKSIVLDTTPPTFRMRFTGSGGEILLKPSSTDTTTAQGIYGYERTEYKDMESFVLSVDTFADNASGLAAGTYPWTLYRYINGKQNPEDGALDVAVPDCSGTFDTGSPLTITIPTVTAGGSSQPSSGRYYVSLKLKDNVNNETIEQRIGFVYDERKPYVAKTRLLKEDETVLPFIGSTYWINDSNLYIQARATDKLDDTTNTAHDPYGSGISTILLDYDKDGPAAFETFQTYTYTSASSPTFAEGGAIVYDPGNASTWFNIGLQSGSSVNKSFATVSGDTTVRSFRVYFRDRMGNLSDATNTTFNVTKDVARPTISASSSNFMYGYDPSVYYLNSSSTSEGETSITPTFNDVGAGLRAWIMKSADSVTEVNSPPLFTDVPNLASDADISAYNSAWASYGGAWKKGPVSSFNADFTAAPQTAPFHSTTSFPSNTDRYVRFYAIDFCGNISNGSLYAGKIFRMDIDKPTISSFTIDDGAGTTKNASGNVTLKVTVLDSGSGVKKLVFTGTSALNITVPTTGPIILTGNKGKEYEITYSPTTITFTPQSTNANRNPGGATEETFTISAKLSGSEGLKEITVKALDAVGNESVTSSKSILWDKTAPIVGSMSIQGFTGTWVKDNIINLVIPFTEADTGSGVYKIVLGGLITGLENDATITVGSGTTIPKGSSSGWEYNSSTKTITLPAGITNSVSPIIINRVTLPSSFSDATLTVQLEDTATNLSTVGSMTNLKRDTDKPASVSIELNGNAEWTTIRDVTATIKVTENGSGIEKFVFTGINPRNATITSPSGLVKDTVNTDDTTLVLMTVYPKQADELTFTISNLRLPDEQGPHDVSIVVYDLAGNSSTIVGTPNPFDSIKLDSRPPTTPSVTHVNPEAYEWTDGSYNFYSGATTKPLPATAPAFDFTVSSTDPDSGGKESGFKEITYSTTLAGAKTAYISSNALAAGSYWFWAQDKALNYSEPRVVKVYYDVAPPVATTTSVTQDDKTVLFNSVYYYKDSIEVDLDEGSGDTGTDPSGFRRFGYYHVIDATQSATTWLADGETTATINEVLSGVATYHFISQDYVGNSNSTTTLNIRKDTTLPPIPTVETFTGYTSPPVDSDTTILESYTGGNTYTYYTSLNNVTVTLKSTDADSGTIKYFRTINSVTSEIATPSITIALNDDSNKSFTLTAMDRVGNVSNPVTVNIQRDMNGPASPEITGVALVATEKKLFEADEFKEYYTTDDNLKITFKAGSDPTGFASGFKRFKATGGGNTVLSSNASDVDIELPVTTTKTTWTIESYDRVMKVCGTPITLILQKQEDTVKPGNVTVAEPLETETNSYEKPTNYWYASSPIEFTLSGGDDTASGLESYYYSMTVGVTTTEVQVTGTSATITPTATETKYKFFSKDNLGKTSNYSDEYTVLLDNTAPNLPAAATTIAATVVKKVQHTSTDTYFKTGTFSFTPYDIGSGPGKYLINNSASAVVSDFASGSVSWTSGTAVGPLDLQTYVTANATTAKVVYVHLIDNVGKISSFQVIDEGTNVNWWCDTIPPLSSTITTNSGFFFKPGTGDTATIFYRDLGNIQLSCSDTFLSGVIETRTISAPGAGADIIVTDTLGNTRTITVTYVADATPPAFSGNTTDPLPFEFSSASPKIDNCQITASDTDESGVNASTLKCYYSTVLLAHDAGINTTTTASTTKWNTYYIKESKNVYILYTGTLIKGHWDSTDDSHVDLPGFDSDNIDYFLVIAMDNVGRKTSQIIERNTSATPRVYKKKGDPVSVSRRGFVPPSGGDVATDNEYELDSPIKNAYLSTGDSLIDWNTGYASLKPSRQNVIATAPTGKDAMRTLTAKKTGKAAKAAKSAPAVDVDSFHRLALGETGANSDATLATATMLTTASYASNVGNGEPVIGTHLLPDSVVEARVSVISPLAEKFMTLRGVRFATDPQTDARNRLLALVRAGAGGVRVRDGWSQETTQPADIGGIGVDRPVAGLVPGKNGEKG